MRLLVARPFDVALATAEKLRRRGHRVLVAPALEIALTHARQPEGEDFALALASSAQAFGDWPAGLWRGPIGCVGEKTARAAARAGFDPRWIAPQARKLVEILCRELSPQRALYLAGRERKPALELGLGAAGWSLAIVETYATVEVGQWPEAVRAALAAGEIDGFLHYSARSARAALRLAGAEAAQARHFCLSDEVAAVVAPVAAGANIFVASQPDEEALLVLLDAF